MKKNSLMRYIDSCLSNIARKIQDEFDESKHPRDKGGKFTSKGGEGTGGGEKFDKLTEKSKSKYDRLKSAEKELEEAEAKYGGKSDQYSKDMLGAARKEVARSRENLKTAVGEDYLHSEGDIPSSEEVEEHYGSSQGSEKSAVEIDPKVEDNIREQFTYDLASIEQDADSEEEFIANAIEYLEITLPDTADTDERAMDNYGADAKTVAAVVNKMIEEFKGKEPTEYGMSYEEQEEIDNVLSALTQYASDKETADILLDRLNWDKEGLSTEDEYAMAIESAVQNDPKKARELLKELDDMYGSDSQGSNSGEDEEKERSPETDEKIKSEFEEGLDVVKQDADSEEEYRQKADEYLSWALDATAKTDEQAMENYGVSSKVVADIVNKLRENLGSSSHYTEAPNDKGKKQLESALKGWWTRADEMVEDLKDAGYEDVEYVNDELMYVSKDGVDYRVSLDKAGRTITAKRVEIV